jgi:O-antigen ligase
MEVGEFSFSVGDIVGEVLVTERVYLALVSVISFVFSLDLITRATKRNKIILIINIIIIVLFILLISARMALLSLLLIGVYNLLFLKKFKLLVLGFILGGLFLSIAFILNENLQNRFFYKNKEATFVENFKKWEPRVEIWQCVFILHGENTVSHKLFGYGSFKTTQEKLLSCYSESIDDPTKKKWFLKIQYNTHNQFFDFLLALGTFGVILFLTPILLLIYKCRSNRINISLLMAFLMVCLVENCLHRQIGVYLFGLLLITVMSSFKEINMNEGING